MIDTIIQKYHQPSCTPEFISLENTPKFHIIPVLCSLYYAIVCSSWGAEIHSRYITSDPHCGFGLSSAPKVKLAALSLPCSWAQSYINSHSLQQKSLCWRQKACTFKSITSCLLSLLCICPYLHQDSKQSPAFSAVSWKHNLSANYLRNYCTWAGYDGLRANEKIQKGGLSTNRETTFTGEWSNFSDNPLTHCCGNMGQKRTTRREKEEECESLKVSVFACRHWSAFHHRSYCVPWSICCVTRMQIKWKSKCRSWHSE